ncbi:hypothetical protein A2U01_0033155, partial [Trifolium medium]|nr:hypothetical protein [Trifolium medium]
LGSSSFTSDTRYFKCQACDAVSFLQGLDFTFRLCQIGSRGMVQTSTWLAYALPTDEAKEAESYS